MMFKGYRGSQCPANQPSDCEGSNCHVLSQFLFFGHIIIIYYRSNQRDKEVKHGVKMVNSKWVKGICDGVYVKVLV